MRKLAVLVALTLTLLLAACTASSMPPARHTSGTLIAWISTPAPPTTSSTTTTTTLAPAPFCASSSLKARLGPPLVGSDATVYVTNIGKTTCRLSGFATLMLVPRVGRHIQVTLRHRPQSRADYPVATSHAANLAPGATGGFLVGEYSCGYVNVPSTTTTSSPAGPKSIIAVYLPHGEGSLRTDALVSGYPPTTPYCDRELGELILPPLQPLTLGCTIISAPDMVKAGRVLHYTVMLSNPRVQLGGLAHCPGYTEALDCAGEVHQYSYLLNCTAIERLGPKRPATLAMVIPVPAMSGVQAATLTWRLDRPNAYPTLELAVTIARNPSPGSIRMTSSGTIVVPLTTTTTLRG